MRRISRYSRGRRPAAGSPGASLGPPVATGATAELDMISMVSDGTAAAIANGCLVCHFVILRWTWPIIPQMEDKACEQGERHHGHSCDGVEEVVVGGREDHREGDDRV